MIWTLTSGLTAFEIANGIDRTARLADRQRSGMTQNTQEDLLSRAEWITAWPDHASRYYDLSIPVAFPECASLEAAMVQANLIPAQCPKGGTLSSQYGSSSVTWSQAWITGIIVEPHGIRNLFTFNLRAINPDTAILSRLAVMNAAYIANLSDVTGLAGGTSTQLDSIVTTDVEVGFCAFLPALLIGSIAIPKMMHLITDPDPGVTVENVDPDAGRIIVLPDDYDESTNAKIWVERL